ncbi:TonB-dependent receptor [Methylophaga sp.]|uniref:TonB-dependent siderophore receptor n=1 Tax=Methylophaga sp. TaxID=2024840 RepID=UPI0027263767|nr:TonB-dependent receptor [Methylophaga sp.]MDO8826093.1 TonB-dependent receptor [Methylophaga sp.]
MTSEMVMAEPAVQTQTQQYTLPAGSLDNVLNQFAAAAGVMLTIDGALTQGLSSNGLRGQYSIQDGFSTILAGTDLQVVRQANNRYMLAVKNSADTSLNLPMIKVDADRFVSGSADNAYRVQNASVGALGNKSISDTPFTIESFSRDFIENIQARSISDIAKYDAGVSLSSGNLLNENNEFKIRGNFIDSDTGQRIDGMTAYNRASDLPIEHFDSVEVLKGAGGFLYGFGTPGGVVNYRLKRPTEKFAASLNTQIMDSGLFLGHLDAGGRFGPDDQLGVRVNALREAGNTYTDEGSSYRKSGSIAVDWHITPNLLWEADALLAERKTYGGYRRIVLLGLTPGSGNKILDPIDGDKSLAPEWARYESDHKTYGSNLTWQFHENWSNKISYRYSSNYRDPMVPDMRAQPNGDYTSNLIYFNNRFKTHHIEDVISGSFNTGFIRHAIALGYSHSRTTISNSTNLLPVGYTLPTGNLSDPVIDIPRVADNRSKGDATSLETSVAKRKDIFISDTIHFGDQWDLILGIRRSSLEEKYADYDGSKNTPTYALVYRPVEWMSLYGSYIESLEQGGAALNTSVNANEIFPPKVSKQYEVGMKVDRNNWSANMAVFQLEKAELYTDPVTQITSQNGEVRYQGIELSAKAMLTPEWMLGASAMWIDGENITVSNLESEGKNPVGVAEKEFRLFSEYHIPATGLTLTGGASYTGKRPYDALNEYHLGSVTLFDLGARYETRLNKQPLTIRLSVENVTDEAFWLMSSGGVLQGAPRRVKLGAQIDF